MNKQQYIRPGFAVLFGIVGPLLCVWFDPVVFRVDEFASFGFDQSLLGWCQAFSYALIALSAILFALHLSGWPRARRLRPLMAGCFLAAAAFSLVLGVCLAPFAAIGLVVLVGIPGFVPFFTAAVYYRAARRLIPDGGWRRQWPAVITGFAICSGLALGCQFFVEHSYRTAMASLTSPSPSERDAGISAMRALDTVFGHQRLVAAIRSSGNDAERQNYLAAYEAVTGRDLEPLWLALND